ncbi:right-handed parallel beta-helix repeat-containing protein [Flavobacterium frigidarium]|uniref:Right-handed parallel beta-helix repeat-containing protein n=1 Tax=Flavobacterium frigidarium TaxID=99286 RepID=A0ABV4K9F2_9FLAO
MSRIILICFLFSFSLIVKSQEFKLKKMDPETIKSTLNRTIFNKKFLEYKIKAFDVGKNIDSLARAEKKDLTLIIQNALNQNKVVLLPNYVINVNDGGLLLNSDQILLFQPKTVLRLIPSSKMGYSILKLQNVDNVKIFNANIEGDKYSHLNDLGQWGFGINIKSSNNITIYSPYIKKTWGDGIYIGQIKNRESTGIRIYNAVIDDVRRNGISITSASGVVIKDSYIGNTNGNSPESALDIEPNSIDDIIENIDISNLSTSNNKWAGILIVFEKFKSTIGKDVSIYIDGHKDIGSKNGIAFHGYRNDNFSDNLNGFIEVRKLNYKENSAKYFFYKTNFSSLEIKTNNCELKNQFNNSKKLWKP